MKKILIAIWNKIKQYRAVIVMYAMMLVVSIVSDIMFGGFNIIKYIAYAVLLAILVIVMVVYKDKIKQAIDDVENKVDNKIKQAIDDVENKVDNKLN